MLFPRGKQKTWWYRFRFGGRIIHESAKTQSKTVAREAEKQRRRQLEESWNGIQPKKRALPPTFERAAREWLENRRSIEASTRETYQHALKHLVAFFGNGLICDIDAPDVTAYKDHRSAEGAAGATVKKEFTILACILADHGQWHKIRRKVKSPDENKSAGRALLQDEEIKLLQAASEVGLKQGHWSPIYTVTVLGLNTGLRHSEVRKLRWERVDMIRRVLVAGIKTEAGKDRPVPLTQPAWTALDVWDPVSLTASRPIIAFQLARTATLTPPGPSHIGGRLGSGLANWRDSRDCGIMICGIAP
jgi:integrase